MLVLVVAALMAAMVVVSALPSLAELSEGSSCKGIVTAAQKSENPKVFDQVYKHGCKTT